MSSIKKKVDSTHKMVIFLTVVTAINVIAFILLLLRWSIIAPILNQ